MHVCRQFWSMCSALGKRNESSEFHRPYCQQRELCGTRNIIQVLRLHVSRLSCVDHVSVVYDHRLACGLWAFGSLASLHRDRDRLGSAVCEHGSDRCVACIYSLYSLKPFIRPFSLALCYGTFHRKLRSLRCDTCLLRGGLSAAGAEYAAGARAEDTLRERRDHTTGI